MKLTTRARYAVAAMVDLAALNCVEPAKLASIAERQGISLAYLEQLFNRMRRAGLVRSVRGPGGGYCLSITAAEISIADVIRAVDGVENVAQCDDPKDCLCSDPELRYGTEALWQALSTQINMYLDNVSLAQIVAGAIPEPLVAQAVMPDEIRNSTV